jgi:large repetitive protein
VLTWAAPQTNGGATITDYVIRMSSDGVNWTIPNDGVSAVGRATIGGLADGTRYLFRVAAKNSAGVGPYASVVAASTLLGAPTGVVATPGDGFVQLDWTAPAGHGSPAITDYVIRMTADGVNWTVPVDGVSANPSATISGLTNGTLHRFRVAATNASGTGAFAPVAYATPTGG